MKSASASSIHCACPPAGLAFYRLQHSPLRRSWVQPSNGQLAKGTIRPHKGNCSHRKRYKAVPRIEGFSFWRGYFRKFYTVLNLTRELVTWFRVLHCVLDFAFRLEVSLFCYFGLPKNSPRAVVSTVLAVAIYGGKKENADLVSGWSWAVWNDKSKRPNEQPSPRVWKRRRADKKNEEKALIFFV